MLRNLLATLITMAILVGYDQLAGRGRPWRAAVAGFTGLACLAFGARGAQRLSELVRDLREWDFLAFWVPARAAALGADFYDPRALHQIPLPRPVSPAFTAEVLDVGFLYPPWTMLLLEPIGAADARTAATAWAVLQGIVLTTAVVLLQRVFAPRQGWHGLLFAAALTLGFQPTTDTLLHGQTNFMLLLAVTAFWAAGERAAGGVYLALATVVKPLAAVLVLVPLLRRSWHALAALAATLGGATVLSGWVFGWDRWVRYATTNPAAALPPGIHVEGIRQSLLAEILRMRHGMGATLTQPLLDPWYLAAGAALLAVTGWALVRASGPAREPALALVFPCALLVYPAENTYHAVILLVPLLWLWTARGRAGLGPSLTILVMTTVYLLTRINLGFDSFYAYLLLWTALAYCALRGHRGSGAAGTAVRH